jgi:hypothetical protein
MTDGESRDVLQRMRTLTEVRALGGHDGGALLQKFVNNKDEAAFEVLVHRHGPMVMGVCRRILGEQVIVHSAPIVLKVVAAK